MLQLAPPVIQPVAIDEARRPALAGLAAILLFFGLLGGWAALAPLHGAVVAQAVVKVEGNRKSVQHLDGGTVRQLLAKEGDHVAADQVLVVLDDGQARAEVEVLRQQHLVLRASEARLLSELERRSTITFPDEILAEKADRYVQAVMDGETRQFQSRRIALAGQRKVLEQRVSQFEEQITGFRGVEEAYRQQLASIRAEADSLRSLVERGLVSRPRILQLDRAAQGVDAQLADNVAARGRAEQGIGELRQQILQLESERLTEVTRELRDVQAKLLDVIPRLHYARSVLSRTTVRAPYAGRVVALNVFGQGAVIGRGEKILDIVPDKTSLIVEAQVAVDDINDVKPGQPTEVHFTAFKQRIMPRIRGSVVNVSADRLVDQRTNQAYFTALIAIEESDLASVPDLTLYPGMSVNVMIQTVERTALDYLLSPLTQSFNRAFRER